MKRKIVQHGSTSLTITLPIQWATKYKLKKGDELETEEKGSTLIISTGNDISSGKKVITVENGKFTKNELSHLYQLGYDELEIEIKDKETIKEINSRLPNCMGFEIIDQKENKIYIKSIASTLETEFDNMLRKCFLITEDMGKELKELIEKKEWDRIEEIRNFENLNNKFTDICIRILNKKGYKNQQRTMQMYEIVKNLERIGDEYKYICDYIKVNNKLEKNFITNLSEVIDYFSMFVLIFFKENKDLNEKMYSQRKILMNKLKIEIKKSKDPILFHFLINIVQKTYEGFGGYSALIL